MECCFKLRVMFDMMFVAYGRFLVCFVRGCRALVGLMVLLL